MDYFYDIALRQFVDASGSARIVRSLRFMRDEEREMSITILDNGSAWTASGTAAVTFGIKQLPGEDSATLAIIQPAGFTLTAGKYVGTLELNGDDLSDLLGDDFSLKLYSQLVITDDDGTHKSDVIPVVMGNDIIRGNEGTPTELPDPDTYVRARAVVYDAAQSLSGGQQTQARSNINAETAGAAATVQAASLQKASNLSDLTSASTARSNLGLSNAATMTVDADIASLSLPANTTISTFGAGLVDDADASAARSTLGLGTAATLTASTAGGASTVLQYDGSGNIVTGPTYTGTTAFDSNGNITMPDLHGFRWLKRDGSISGYGVYAWEQHDAFGGELIIGSPHRTAVICPGAFQLGDNASGLRTFHLHLVSGGSTVSRTIRWSPAISFQTKGYNSGAEVTKRTLIQAVPTDQTNATTNLKFFLNGTITDSDTSIGSYTSNAGLCTGDLALELDTTGAWHPGQAPTYTTLTDGATITQTCSKYKAVQNANVTLGGNRTLAFSGALAGMRGNIYVTQDGSGSRTLTPSGGAALGLSTTAGVTDRVQWDYDGVYFNFSVTQNVTRNVILSDSDAQAFVTAASITDATQKAALDTLVQSLKSASLWTRWHALYPFVGGTSSAHAVNLKSPGTYNITWSGSPTHNSNGVTGDGTAAYGNTNLNPSSVMSVNSSSVYTYCRTQTPTASSYFCGSTTATTRLGYAVSSGNLAGHGPNDNNGGVLVVSAGSDFRKHFAIDRSGASAVSIFANSTKVAGTTASVSAPNGNFFILARNASGAPNGYTNANIAFQALGGSLSDSEWTTFRGIIDTFQTALGRANS